MERLPGIYKFLYILVVLAVIYDVIYCVIDAQIKVSSLTEIWLRQHPQSMKAFYDMVVANLGKGAWISLKKWMDLPAQIALLIPPAILHIIYTIWYSMTRGKRGAYPYSRE